MQSSPNRFSQKKSSKLPVARSHFTSAQHESHHSRLQHQQQPGLNSSDSSNNFHDFSGYRSILHRAPYETLCHIIAYLDPPSLEALSQVDRYLRKCISDDVVWRSALFFSVLGIHPERERESPRRFLLRRLESTWKGEYITRYNVLYRWNKSRTVTTAHHPMLIPVPHIHLLGDGNSLLTAPDHFSWVFRSMPATGKNLKGFFQPTRSHEAHPLQDWSPPSTGAISSYGGTARIAWASQLGDIMVKTAPKAMDKTAHSTATSITSLAVDRHVGIVSHVAWAVSKSPVNKYLTTAGSDGLVKIWDAETCAAIWTSSRSSDDTGYVKALLDVSSRTLVALTQSGELKAWSPIQLDANSAQPGHETKAISAWVPAGNEEHHPQTASFTLILERAGPVTSAIVHAKDNKKAWRFIIRFEDERVLLHSLCGPVGPITAFHLDNSNASEVSILMLGDSLSQVSIYDLGTESSTQNSPDFSSAAGPQPPQQVDPNVTFSAHEVGAVTTIASNCVLLVTGNEFGVINVWNAVTLEAVRTINASDHAKNGIGALAIVLQIDQLVASVGRSVVHWKTGKWESAKQSKSAKKKRVATKGKRRVETEEYYLAIAESQAELKDAITGAKRATVTENDQRNALLELGLDESAAVEYALMLSHDEALHSGDLIEVNDQEIPEVPPPTESAQLNIQNIQNLQHSPGPSSTSSISSSVREDFMPSSPWKSKSMSRVSPPNSIGKVQVSAPYRPEALRIGPPSPSSSVSTNVSPIARLKTEPGLGGPKNISGSPENNQEFPRITPPSSGKTTRASTPPKSPISHATNNTTNSNSNNKLKVAATSQTSLNQATPKWSSIVKSSSSSASVLPGAVSSPPTFASITGGGKSRSFRRPQPEVPTDEEAQLQFALELSLAEAMSLRDA